MNLNKKWLVGLVGLVLVIVSIFIIFKSLEQEEPSKKQPQAEQTNHEYLPAKAQEADGKSSTMAEKEWEQANEPFQQSSDEKSSLDEREEEIEETPSSTPFDEEQEQALAEIEAIQAKIKTVEAQLQEDKQQINALARQTGEINELNEANRVRVRQLKALRGDGREIAPEENMRILNEIRSLSMKHEIMAEVKARGLKYKNLLEEFNLLQEELDLSQDSIQEAGN